MGQELLFQRVMDAHGPDRRWAAFTRGLADLGLDQINYAFLDMQTFDRMEARGDPAMSTMRADWIAYYAERGYDLDDELVAHVRQGHFAPKVARLSRLHREHRPEIADEGREAGLNAGLLVPLPGPWNDMFPAAAIMLGSSLGEDEVVRIIGMHAPSLVALAHVLHTGMSGELLRLRDNAAALTGRERDCLQYAARGDRTARIAERLGIVEATVGLHLSNARRKLAARTLSEAVAKAILYQ